jgi:hypothetical protein
MTDEQFLRLAFVSIEVSDDFTEAVVGMGDGSRLSFGHRVAERWAKALPDAGLADQVLQRVAQFRLNSRHLDVQFHDGSRWEARFGDR